MHDSIANGRIIVVPTQNPGYVKLCLSSLESVHELLQSSITIHEERVCISPKKLKEEFGKRINEQIGKTESIYSEEENCMMGWKIETEVVGPSLRLICEPVCEDLAYPEIFYRDFDEEFSTLDERLQDVSSDLAM